LLATEKSRAGDRGIDYCLAYFRFPQVAEAATPLQAALKRVKSDASLETMNKLVRTCALFFAPRRNTENAQPTRLTTDTGGIPKNLIEFFYLN